MVVDHFGGAQASGGVGQPGFAQLLDLVSSGNTLKANHLVEIEEIMPISARLIVNQAALKIKRDRVQPLLDAFANAVKQRAVSAAKPGEPALS